MISFFKQTNPKGTLPALSVCFPNKEHIDGVGRKLSLQRHAERIYIESNGEWGTPPNVPLPSYDEACLKRGVLDRSEKTKWRDVGQSSEIK